MNTKSAQLENIIIRTFTNFQNRNITFIFPQEYRCCAAIFHHSMGQAASSAFVVRQTFIVESISYAPPPLHQQFDPAENYVPHPADGSVPANRRNPPVPSPAWA